MTVRNDYDRYTLYNRSLFYYVTVPTQNDLTCELITRMNNHW